MLPLAIRKMPGCSVQKLVDGFTMQRERVMGGHHAGAARGWAWLVLVPILALLTACGGAGTNRTAPTTETGTVTVQLIWGTPNVVPPAIKTISSTITVGTFEASESQLVTAWPNSTQTVTSPAGTGSLQIDAFNGNGIDLFSRTVDVTVVPNAIVEVVVVLVALPPMDAPDSIQITPGTAAIAAGTTQQYSATGTYLDGNTPDMTGSVTWKSSDPTVATIDSVGLATGVGPGIANITATFSSSTKTVTSNMAVLNVNQAALVSIQVTPPTANIALGTTQTYEAIGTYTDHNTQVITGLVSWNSSNPSVAKFGKDSVAASEGLGATKITASLGDVTSKPVNLAVSAATLASIQVTPESASIAAGRTRQYMATGVFTDNSTQDLTAQAAWSSDAAGVATITGMGVATGVTQGTAHIIASFSGVQSNTATLNVTAASLVSILVNPGTTSIAEGITQQYAAIGTYTDGSTPDITRSVTWGSSNREVATISSSGLATGVDEGTAAITAGLGGVMSAPATLNVTPETLVSIQVNPSTASIAAGTTQQYTAIGTYTDGSTPDITRLVAWSSSSSDTGEATIGTSGLATGVAAGTVTITASLDTVLGTVTSNTATLSVTSATLNSVRVTPSTASIAQCATQQFTATGTYTDGSKQDLTTVSSWISSATKVATVSSAGLARGVAMGSTNITATYFYGGATFPAAAALTVTSASVCDSDSVGEEHSGGNGDDRNGRGDGDDHSRRGDDRHRGH